MVKEVAPIPTVQIYLLYQYPNLSQTFIRNEIHALRASGFPVDVLTISPPDFTNIAADWPGDFRVLPCPTRVRTVQDNLWFAIRRPASYARFIGALIRLRDHWWYAMRRLPTEARAIIARGRPRGCHAHFAWPSSSLAAYLSRLLNVPASITVHANDIYVGDDRLRVRLQLFDRLVTVCNFNVGLLAGLGVKPVGSNDVVVVPCGVAVPDQPTVAQGARAAEIVSVGRLVEKKGFDTLIRAMAVVRDCIQDVHLTIIGDGPQRSTLIQLVVDLEVEENVTVAGAMSHQATLDLIASAKVFCLASCRAGDGDCDAVPVVIREAMARSIPVIATRVAGIPETVDDEVGWLVSPRSPDELAGVIIAALTDGEDSAERGRAGRVRVVRRWTLEAQATAMRQVFAGTDVKVGRPVVAKFP